MRLLQYSQDGDFILTRDFITSHSTPPYAILSHTWATNASDEVTFDDLMNGTGRNKPGFEKIRFCGAQAKHDGLDYFWIDTCCINKANYTELSQAINSMFRWYQASNKCYVYLADVSIDDSDSASQTGAFQRSRWFTRGWTLQELLAPPHVEFFSSGRTKIGDKQSLETEISQITGIDPTALRGNALSDFSINERISWASRRETTLEEDQVYCILGVLDVSLPLIYGEGVEKALRRLRKELSTIDDSTLPLNSSAEDKMDACLQSLDPTDQARFLSEMLNRSQSAFQWLPQSSKCRAWLECDQSTLLWITAKAGCGKTTAAAHIIESASSIPWFTIPDFSNQECKSVVLYFFFQRSNHEAENSALAALRTLTSQLMNQEPQVLRAILKRFNLLSSKGGFEWSWGTLSKAFAEMLRQVPPTSRIYLVLDAIDECEQSSRHIVIDWIKSLVQETPQSSLRKKRSTLKVLATSRPENDILDILQETSTLAIKNTNTANDVKALIYNRVEEFARIRQLRPGITREIIQFLEDNAEGMFLWVDLVMKELERRDERLSNEVIASKLSKVPLTLVDTYKAILQAAPLSRKEDMWRMIRWLLFGCRSLTMEELEIGMCLETGDSSWHGFAGDLEFLCGPLIRLDGPDKEVNLIHQIARSFLEDFTQNSGLNDVSGIEVEAQMANEHLATICVQYLLELDDSVNLTALLAPTNTYAGYRKTLTKFLRRFAFLRYAVESWAPHIRKVNNPSSTLVSMVQRLLASSGRRANIMILTYFIFKHGSSNVPVVHEPLHLAAYFNLPWLVESYISEGVDVNTTACSNDTPLVWASEMGSTACVKILLEAGADPNLFEVDGWSALHWAARNGHVYAAKLLLKHGAQAHAQDSGGHIPLEWAIDREYWSLVELLQGWMTKGRRRSLGNSVRMQGQGLPKTKPTGYNNAWQLWDSRSWER